MSTPAKNLYFSKQFPISLPGSCCKLIYTTLLAANSHYGRVRDSHVYCSGCFNMVLSQDRTTTAKNQSPIFLPVQRNTFSCCSLQAPLRDSCGLDCLITGFFVVLSSFLATASQSARRVQLQKILLNLNKQQISEVWRMVSYRVALHSRLALLFPHSGCFCQKPVCCASLCFAVLASFHVLFMFINETLRRRRRR